MIRRAVVIGSGSAGRRHLIALVALDPTLQVTLVRRHGSVGLDNSLATVAHDVVTSVDTVVRPFPAIGIVASPAPHHPRQIRMLLDNGAAVLTEKPLAADLRAAITLRDHPGAQARLLVGYHLRFGDVAPAMREYLAGGIIGEPTAARLEVGQHLSAWRPQADPRDSVSARQELGGGVLLELSHELDALRYLLDTEIHSVSSATLGHDGAPTDGIVETVADLRLRTTSGVDADVHLDMISDPARRRWHMTGTGGALSADLLAGTITVERHGTDPVRLSSFAPGERDRAEARLLGHLVDIASGDASPRCTVHDGLAALAVIDAARRCAATGGPVPVEHLSLGGAP